LFDNQTNLFYDVNDKKKSMFAKLIVISYCWNASVLIPERLTSFIHALLSNEVKTLLLERGIIGKLYVKDPSYIWQIVRVCVNFI